MTCQLCRMVREIIAGWCWLAFLRVSTPEQLDAVLASLRAQVRVAR